jgi:hypothetical protein
MIRHDEIALTAYAVTDLARTRKICIHKRKPGNI